MILFRIDLNIAVHPPDWASMRAFFCFRDAMMGKKMPKGENKQQRRKKKLGKKKIHERGTTNIHNKQQPTQCLRGV
jgi:hypothetical protein